MGHKATAVCFALALCVLVSTLACEKSTATQPSPTMYTLWGHVTEGGFPLSGATVAVTASWGSNSKQTDSNGDYSGLKASGNVALRAEKEGFAAQVKQLTVDENQVVNFELQRVDTPGDPQGVYTLIITAAPSCTMLPLEARQRNYSARIDRTGNDLQVTLTGGNFVVAGWGWSGWYVEPVAKAMFAGTRDGSTVRFTVGEQQAVESLPSGALLSYVGTATGTISGLTIGATFDGTVLVRTSDYPGTVVAECQAKDHRMEFLR